MSFFPSQSRLAAFAATIALLAPLAARATPLLVVDGRTGDVLLQREATEKWYPASLTN